MVKLIHFLFCRRCINNITLKVIKRQIGTKTRHILCCCDVIRMFRSENERIKTREENYRKKTSWYSFRFTGIPQLNAISFNNQFMTDIQRLNAIFFCNQFKMLFSLDKKFCKHDNILYKILGDVITMKTIVLSQPCYAKCEFARIPHSMECWTPFRNYFVLYFT